VVVGQLDPVVVVLHHGVAFPCLLAQVGTQERAPLVDRDLADPGAWVVQPADPVPVPIGDQEGLLSELLGHQPAAQQPMEQLHHRGVLAEVEHLEPLRHRPSRGMPVTRVLSHLAQ
jgi:hypothetical protein